MLALPLSFVLLSCGAPGGGGSTLPSEPFPPLRLEVGARLPAGALPPIEGGDPVPLYELLGGRPTLLHIFASW